MYGSLRGNKRRGSRGVDGKRRTDGRIGKGKSGQGNVAGRVLAGTITAISALGSIVDQLPLSFSKEKMAMSRMLMTAELQKKIIHGRSAYRPLPLKKEKKRSSNFHFTDLKDTCGP